MNSPATEALPPLRPPMNRCSPVLTEPDRTPHRSKLGRCLRRGAAAGLRVIVIAPRGEPDSELLASFPERQIRPEVDVLWRTRRHLLLGRGTLPHDRASWDVLVADADSRVVATISARFFRAPLPTAQLQILSLAEASGPILREQCELAIKETHEAAIASDRMFGEISDLTLTPFAHERLAGVMLVRALAALAGAVGNPLWVFAANQHRNEVPQLMRRGAAPLGRIGKFCLPPFIDQASAAWLRILLVDTAAFHARSRTEPADELDVLRKHAAILSPV